MPQSHGSFIEQADEAHQLVMQLVDEAGRENLRLQHAKVVLSDAQNQYSLLLGSNLYKEVLSSLPLTVVEQPPLNGSKMGLLLKFGDEDDGFKFFSLRLSPDECKGRTSYVQTCLLFDKFSKLAAEQGFTLKDNCVRTWIYVADIDVNYSGVVRARNDVFRSQGLSVDTHFIASTGIGGYTQTREACVGIDFLVRPNAKSGDFKYLEALDHLNPTHEYGVAFERGTRLQAPSGFTYFISGTASIDRNGNVMYVGDVLKQAARLLENIESLLKDGGARLQDVQYFMVYLRDIADYGRINAYMKACFPDTPYIIVHAKVCRPQWLIEMECIARNGE